MASSSSSSSLEWGLGSKKPQTDGGLGGTSVSASVDSNFQALIVYFYRNGDEHDKGIEVVISRKQFRHWLTFLEYLTKKCKLFKPVNYVFTLDGEPVRHFSELVDGEEYVAASGPFKPCNYGSKNAFKREFNIKPVVPRVDPTPLNSTESIELYLRKMGYKSKTGKSFPEDQSNDLNELGISRPEIRAPSNARSYGSSSQLQQLNNRVGRTYSQGGANASKTWQDGTSRTWAVERPRSASPVTTDRYRYGAEFQGTRQSIASNESSQLLQTPSTHDVLDEVNRRYVSDYRQSQLQPPFAAAATGDAYLSSRVASKYQRRSVDELLQQLQQQLILQQQPPNTTNINGQPRPGEFERRYPPADYYGVVQAPPNGYADRYYERLPANDPRMAAAPEARSVSQYLISPARNALVADAEYRNGGAVPPFATKQAAPVMAPAPAANVAARPQIANGYNGLSGQASLVRQPIALPHHYIPD